MERKTSDRGLESPALGGCAGLGQASQEHSSKRRSQSNTVSKTSEMSKAQRRVAKTCRCLGLAAWVAEVAAAAPVGARVQGAGLCWTQSLQ